MSYYCRIQKSHGPDAEIKEKTLGNTFDKIIMYIKYNNDYKGYFIIKVKD